MSISSQILMKRGLLVCSVLLIIYFSMFCYYLHLVHKEELISASKEFLIQEQTIDLSVIITNNVLLFSSKPTFLNKISNSSAILVSGFGSGIKNADISTMATELQALLHNKSDLTSTTAKKNIENASNNLNKFSDIPKILEGSIADNPFRHAIDTDIHISINDYQSVVIFAPSYYMPKVKMLFEAISYDSNVNYLLYFVPLGASETVFGWDFFKLVAVQFNGYVYLKLYFLLNQYFKLFGFGKRVHQYF